MQRIRVPETCIDTYNQQNHTKHRVVKYMFLRLFTGSPAEVINDGVWIFPLNPNSLIFLVHRLLQISVKTAAIVTYLHIYHNNVIIIVITFLFLTS
jgi:hypothetical protein